MRGNDSGPGSRRRTAHVTTPAPVEASPRARDERALARFARVLVGLTALLGSALVAMGEAFPPLGLLALFAVLAWFSVNRYTFFPSEMSVTAESAVLLASVVVFHRDAPLLGPWCVAVLVGPLDALHWEHRAFSRMAYNAAHQVLAVVPAAVVFDAVLARGHHSWVAFLAAATATAAAFCVIVLVAGVGVLHVYAGAAPRGALRHLLALDWMILPLGVLGSIAGQLSLALGWWVLPLVLVPVAFLPELAVGFTRALVTGTASSVRRRLVLAAAVAAAFVVAPAASAIGGGAGVTVAALFALAVMVGVEVGPGRPARVPPLLGVLVALVASSVAAGWTVLVTGPLVVLTAAAASCFADGVALRRAVTICGQAVAIAFLVVAAGRAVAEIDARGLHAVVATAGGVAFAVVVASCRPAPDRGRQLACVAWSIPLIAIAAALGLVVTTFEASAVWLPIVGLPLVGFTVVTWAAPPWTSRLLGALARGIELRKRFVSLVALSSVAAALGGIGMLRSGNDARAACVLAGLVLVEAELSLAAVGARQWRLTLRGRFSRCLLLAVSSLVILGVVGRSTAGVVPAIVLTLGAGIALIVGRSSARRADAASTLTPERQ